MAARVPPPPTKFGPTAPSAAQRVATPSAAQRVATPSVRPPAAPAVPVRVGAPPPAYSGPAHPGPAKVAQPKFGFEFQTNWTIKAQVNPLKKFGVDALSQVPVFKSRALATGIGWALTNDGGEAEFVLDPIDDGDFARLRTVMSDMLAFIRDVTAQAAGGNSASLWSFNNTNTLGVLEYLDTSAGPISANPQMTAGIKMSKLRYVMAEIGNRRNDPNAADIHYRVDRAGVARLMKECADAAGAQITKRSAEYKSLMALIVSYVALSHMLGAVTESIKQITSLMSRTNLGTAFTQTKEWDNLPTDATARRKVRNNMVKDVVNTAKRAVRAMGGNPAGIAEGLQLSFEGVSNPNRAGPTIGDLVDGLMIGRDVFAWTYGRQRMAVGGSSMGSMGMNKSAPNKAKDDLIIVEFRDFDIQIPLARWAPWAESLARWVHHINTGRDSTFTAYAAAPLAASARSFIGKSTATKAASVVGAGLLTLSGYALKQMWGAMQMKPLPGRMSRPDWPFAGGARIPLPPGVTR